MTVTDTARESVAASLEQGKVLTSHLNTRADLAAIMPLQAFTLVRELTPADRADMQRFVDLAVQQGVVREKIEVDRFLRAL